MAPKVSKEYKDNRKKDILKFAEDVFIQKGYEATTMQDIVDATGMSRGGLYSYFSSTEEIYRAIVKQRDQAAADYSMTIIKKHDTVWDGIKEYIHEFDVEEEKSFAVVVAEYHLTGWRDETRRPYAISRYKNGLKVLVEMLQEGVKRGEFKPQQPLETIASFIINTTDGFFIEAQFVGWQGANIKGQVEALELYLKTVLQVTE